MLESWYSIWICMHVGWSLGTCLGYPICCLRCWKYFLRWIRFTTAPNCCSHNQLCQLREVWVLIATMNLTDRRPMLMHNQAVSISKIDIPFFILQDVFSFFFRWREYICNTRIPITSSFCINKMNEDIKGAHKKEYKNKKRHHHGD
jgi:hypothetical protein